MNNDKCWICGKPSVTYIDFTYGPLGSFKDVCSNDPEQGCYKATTILLREYNATRQAEYKLRELKRSIKRIWDLISALVALKI